MCYFGSLVDLNGKIDPGRMPRLGGIGGSRMEVSVVKITAIVKRMKARPPTLCKRHTRRSHHGLRGALIRPSHEQHVHIKSRKSLGVITRDPRHTRAHAAKWHAPRLRPVRGKYSRASNRQRRTAPKLTTFVTAVRRFMKAYTILWQKLRARFSEYALEQGNRVPVFRVATRLVILDPVSMQTGRLSRVPNHPIERRPSDLVQLPRARKCTHLICDEVATIFITSPNQGGIQ
jgi:hypothetical protein